VMTSVCVHVTCTTPHHSTPALHHSAVMMNVCVHVTCTTPHHTTVQHTCIGSQLLLYTSTTTLV